MATHSSVLAWRIPGTAEPGGLPSMRSQSRTWLKRLSSSRSMTCARLESPETEPALSQVVAGRENGFSGDGEEGEEVAITWSQYPTVANGLSPDRWVWLTKTRSCAQYSAATRRESGHCPFPLLLSSTTQRVENSLNIRNFRCWPPTQENVFFHLSSLPKYSFPGKLAKIPN